MIQFAPENIFAVAAVAVYRENRAVEHNKDPHLLGSGRIRTDPAMADHRPCRGRALHHRRVAAPDRPTSAIYSLCSQRHRAERARRTCRCRFVIERSEIHLAVPMDSDLRSHRFAETQPASQPCSAGSGRPCLH